MLIGIIFIALLGLILASFLSVVAHRLPLGESIVAPRSHCPSCKTQLLNRDNVPLLGYLLQRGRCRHCGVKIPLTYPLLEAGLAAVFVAALLVFEDDPEQIALTCAFACILFTITITDLEHRIIPNKVLIAGLIIGAGIAIPTDDGSMLVERAIAGAAAFGILFIVAIVSRGMGMGDVKLAGVMGLYLGKAIAPSLLIGFLIGAIYGLFLIARQGKAARKQKVPFGPFLALGGLIGIFVGEDIVDWYDDNYLNSD